MKVRNKGGRVPISGKSGDLVYCYNRISESMYARVYTYPTLNENNRKMGSITKNLFKIKPSEAFKHDCRAYAILFANERKNRGIKIWTWSNCYLHLMYAMAEKLPHLDMLNISREIIYAQDLPCISIAAAVNAGILAPVKEYQKLDKQI